MTAGRIAHLPILLVEDDHGDALLVRARLAEVGVAETSITWERGIAGALGALDRSRPAAVLLDLGLPDAEGVGAVQAVVAADPEIPVIVLTGRQDGQGIEALGAGAQDYLVKDTLTGELLERSIRYAMERKRAQHAQRQLREARISDAEKARLERGLLPSPLLLSAAVSCATYYRPGGDGAVLGGDFFDVVETSDGRVHAVIGDVMGHGPDEAALGVHLRVAWRSVLLAGVPDEQVLPALSRLLAAEEPQQRHYATVCDLVIEPGGAMTVRIAGHPAPVLCAEGTSRYLTLEIGPPIGIALDGVATGPSWPTNRVRVPPGSSIVLYTDGLLDAYTGADSDGIGIEELVAGVQVCSGDGTPAAAWISQLVGGAPQTSNDDTAVVVLTVK